MNKPNRRLLERYQLLRHVIHAQWATPLDVRVMSVMVEEWRHYKVFTSIGTLQLVAATGHKRRSDIRASLRRLIQNGVIRILRLGAGTRATEYELNFDLLVGEESSPTKPSEPEILEGEESSPTVGEESSPSRDASGGGIIPTPPISSRCIPGRERGLRADARETLPARRQEAALGSKKAFDALLALYRRPHGEDVPRASTAYLDALTAGHSHDAILAGASAWVGAVEARYLPKLDRFLRDGLFLNEPPTGRKPKANGHRRGKVDVVKAALFAGGYEENADGTLTLVEGDR
jgi:hypothetical protein